MRRLRAVKASRRSRAGDCAVTGSTVTRSDATRSTVTRSDATRSTVARSDATRSAVTAEASRLRLQLLGPKGRRRRFGRQHLRRG